MWRLLRYVESSRLRYQRLRHIHFLTPSNAPCPRQIKLRATTPASASLGQPNAALVTFYIGRHGRQGIEEVGVVVAENKRLACR